MSPPVTTREPAPRVTAPLLAACVLLSVAVHLGTAVGAGAYLTERTDLDLLSSARVSMPDLPAPVDDPDPPLRLGRSQASTAAISWLGVTRDPVLGEGKESQVEQAELAIVTGDKQDQSMPAPVPVEPQRAAEAMPDAQPVNEHVAEPIAQSIPEPIAQAVPQSAEDPAEQQEKDSIDEPVEQPQPEPAAPVVVPLDPERAIVEATQQPEAQDIPDAIAAIPIKEAEPQPSPEPNPEPADTTVPAEAEPQQGTESPAQSAVVQVDQPPSDPSTAGKAGPEDERESIATIIKNAEVVRVASLNAPLSAQGLEIRTVEPRFPATVRFTQLPRNPIVLIRFNAEGRVINARFLHDEEKKKIYDTGSKGVDEPLLSAIYKWRAVGKALETLEPGNPESTIEISMKILFREE
jgi:hypothetical protein